HPAQGGRPARPGPGRVRGRHEAARDGLRPLRPRALRARPDRLRRRLGPRGWGVCAEGRRRTGMVDVHFARAPYAHALIVSVDVSAAEALDGVYGTLSPDEGAELTDPFFELTTPPG